MKRVSMVRLICLGLSVLAAAVGMIPGFAQTTSAGPNVAVTEDLMDKAVRYVGVITGREVGGDDVDWLRGQWRNTASTAPVAVAAHLDQMAFNLEQIERDHDPVRLASLRSSMIDEAYCAAAWTTDPEARRMKEILAPDDLIVASACVFGFVVTRFDLEGVVASHGLVAEITGDIYAETTGNAYDRPRDLTSNTDTISSQFQDLDLAQQAFIASGEVRHAVAEKFWSRIDGDDRQTEVADVLGQQVREADGNLWHPARNLETLASEQLGAVDYIAEVEGVRLTAAITAEYRTWWQRIAGYEFSSRDLAWIEEALIRAFRKDPNAAQGWTADVEAFNRKVLLEDDPARKATMLAAEEARVYCYLQSSEDEDDAYLADLLFRQDPVTDSDCPDSKITRRNDTILAESGGHVLTEGHIAESAAFLELLLARSPTLDERAFLREQEIKEFGEDLENWRKGLDYLRGLMAEYRGKGQLFFLKEDIRLKQFRGMYCYFKQATKPYHAEFVTMLQKAHDIVYENCEQQVVSTERAVDGYVATLNFVAFLADVPLLSDEEEATIRNDVKHWQLGSEAGLASLVQWWSWLSPEKKEQELAKIRNKGLRRATDVADNLNAYTDVAGVSLVLMEAKMNSCQVLAVIEQGTAKLHIAEAGPKFGRELDWNPLGVNVGRLSQLQSLGTFYSAFCT